MTAVSPAPAALFQQPWPEGEYRFFQLGFVVDDLLGAAANWAQVYGIGPFHVLPKAESRGTYRGQPSVLEIQVAVAQAGPVQIELIHESTGAESVFRDFAGRPAGFHQVCTLTYDYDRSLEHYASLGYEVAAELIRPTQRVAFVDTLTAFGFYTEVVEATPSFVTALSGVAQTCAEWDGTDPVRLLTRDGYRLPD